MKDCSIQLTNHPGDFARVAQALAVMSVGGGHAIGRIIPDDIVVARHAFQRSEHQF